METSESEKTSLLTEIRTIGRLALRASHLIPTGRKLALVAATGLMIITSAGNTSVALLLGSLIDSIHVGLEQALPKGTLYANAFRILVIISAIYLIRDVLHVFRRHLVDRSCSAIGKDIQTQLVSHLLKTELILHSQDKLGALHGKIVRSTDGMVRFVRLMFLDCLPGIMTGVFAISTAVTKQPLLGAVMLGVIPLSVWLTLWQLNSQKGVRLKLLRDTEEIDGIVVEQLFGAEYIRVANTFNLEVNRLSSAAETRRRREVRHHFEMSLFGCAKSLNEGFFHLLVLGIAISLAVNQRISFGDILAFSALFMNVMAPLNDLHRIVDEGQEASLHVGDLMEMLGQPADKAFSSKTTGRVALAPGQNAFEIQDVVLDFISPDGQQKRGIDGVSFQIRHGETIGIAGPSGAGKSTLIKSLLRLVHPKSGRIHIGNTPMDDINREELARLIAYVGQNPFVFCGSVRDNIAYGNEGLSDDEIYQAAQMACLHEEIHQMPKGYETHIVERGLNISGGQCQRLAIARTLIKDSPILILDEATSALDNINERLILDAINKRVNNRTTIIIAHRLSTLKDCDRILVFDKGRIAEEGNYVELVRRGGIFATLVASAGGELTDGCDNESCNGDGCNEQRNDDGIRQSRDDHQGTGNTNGRNGSGHSQPNSPNNGYSRTNGKENPNGKGDTNGKSVAKTYPATS